MAFKKKVPVKFKDLEKLSNSAKSVWDEENRIFRIINPVCGGYSIGGYVICDEEDFKKLGTNRFFVYKFRLI